MSTNDRTEPQWYTRPAFVASAALLALVLVAGVYLLVARPGSTSTDPTPSPSVVAPSTSASTSETSSPSGPGCPTLPSDELRAGDGLNAAPKGTTWTPRKFSALASIDGQGPAVTEASGYVRCYAHTLTGAALAAANYSAQMADPDLWEQALRLGAVQEPELEDQIKQMRANGGSNAAGDKFTVVGLTQVTATSDRSVTVGLVLVVGDATVGTDLALQWDGTDWRVQPRVDTSRSIDDYMVWGS